MMCSVNCDGCYARNYCDIALSSMNCQEDEKEEKMSCEYDGCPIEKFCEMSIGIEDCCGTLRAYRKGKADERKKVLDELREMIMNCRFDYSVKIALDVLIDRLLKEQLKGGENE